MAQTHSYVDYMDYGHLVDLDNVMNIGIKGYFKPIPEHHTDGNNADNHFCCVDPIDQLDNQLLDKVSCPYEDPETGMLPPNCKYNDCRECPKCTSENNTYGAAPKNTEPKPRKPRAKKSTAKSQKTTKTKKTDN